MSTLTSAIEIGRSALHAQQSGLYVTGNNIANVNTPGYARKHLILQSSTTVDHMGSGVRVASLTRSRDRYLDGQVRFEGSILGRAEAVEQAMSTVEAIFTELAGGGTTEAGAVFEQSSGAALSGAFSRFFNAFQDMANNPESQATRAVVREEAVFLTDQFHRVADQLSTLRTDLNEEYLEAVDEVNRLTEQIAHLNVKIVETQRWPEDVAGDLEDERDRLIDELSRLIDVSVREQEGGTVTVTVAKGVLLVDKGFSAGLTTRSTVRDGAEVADLALASNGEVVTLSAGKFKGLADARDGAIPEYQAGLDLLAETLVARVNAVHAQGFGLDGSRGLEFFDPMQTTAHGIAVSGEILANLDRIAAAGPLDGSSEWAGPGDGSNALALSDLRLEKALGGGMQTIEEYYGNLVGRVGTYAKTAYTDAESQRLVMAQVEGRRQEVRGVSINEEASELILYQRAYQAAARLVTAVDDMMQSVLDI